MAYDGNDEIGVEDIEEFSRMLALDTFGFIEDNGGDKRLEITITYLSIYIGSLVYKSLTMTPGKKMSKAALLEYTHKNFQNMKENIQNAVSAAFKSALETYSGREADYYCHVAPIGEPVNKQPC